MKKIGVRATGAHAAGWFVALVIGLPFWYGVRASPLEWWYLVVYGALAFAVIRPWFMGVYLRDEAIVIRSWFRRFNFATDDVSRVEAVPYWPAVSTTAIGWLPVLGAIKMLRVQLKSGAERDLRGSVARSGRVVELAAELRQFTGGGPATSSLRRNRLTNS